MRKKILCAVWSAAVVLLGGAEAFGTTTTTINAEPLMTSYVQPPIFQSSAILPNIMVVLDSSGSMTFPAYPDPFNPDSNSPSGDVTGANYAGLNCRAIVPVGTGNDDAVQQTTTGTGVNAVTLTTNPLYMSNSSSKEYVVGLRFASVPIPTSVNGTPVTITKAYIRFTAQQASTAASSYTIAVQDTATPATFTTTASSITSRTWWGTTVSWSASTPAPNTLVSWGLNMKYNTPDLTAQVQHCLAQSGWASGNSIAFKITGAAGSQRYPYSYNGSANYAPQLVIEYTPCVPKTYYGYFDSSARYVYDSTNKYFVRTSLTDSTTWSGNFLNWLCMRRFDVLKKVLIGGKRNVGVDNDTLLGEGAPSAASGSASTGTTNTYYWQNYYLDSEAALATHVSPYAEAWYGMKAGFLYVSTYSCTSSTCSSGNQVAIDASQGGYPWYSPTAATTYRIAVKKDRTLEANDFCGDVNGYITVCGVMQRIGTQAQWGNFWYYTSDTSSTQSTLVTNAIGTPIPTIVRDIEQRQSNGSTPTANAVIQVTNYFKGNTTKNQAGATIGDPFKDAKGNIIPCAKSYMLLLTDGEANVEDSSYTDWDGDGNDKNTTARPYDELDDMAFYAHTTDLRTDIAGKQTMDTYVVYAFGQDTSAKVTLMETAMNGGFRDLNGNGKCDGYCQNASADINAFSTCAPASARGEWDKDGDGIPDNYYEAQAGDQIQAKVLGAINDILNQASSGTAVSVLATTGEGEGTLVQAIFLPGKIIGTQEVDWLGRLQSLWVDAKGNIREDTVNDKVLDITADKIIKYYTDNVTNETMVKRYAVSTAVPYPDTTTATGTAISLDEIQPIWEGGAMLADRDPDDRLIYTSIGSGSASSGGFYPFTVANAAAIRPYLGIESTDFYDYLDATDPANRAANLIAYIRGKDKADLPYPTTAQVRNRTMDGKVWKLGDIVYSTPVTISKPVEQYDVLYSDPTYGAYQAKYGDTATTQRESVVYVGANDGMLHAFTSGIFNKAAGGFTPNTVGTQDIGDELWAYIPRALLPHLKWLADTKYAIDTHVPFVDLKPKVVDVRIFTADTVHPGGWGTVLIGGMNFGGKDIWTNNVDGTTTHYYSSYFAIDVTDPRNPTLLWDQWFPNMGLTTNQPTVLSVGRTWDGLNRTWNSDDHWYLAIGSGFDDFKGFVPGHTGSLYIVDIKTGVLKKQFQTTENAYMTTPLALDKSLNYSVDALYVGENYDNGTTHKSKICRVGIPITTTPYVEGSSARYQWDPTSATNPWTWTTMLKSSSSITLPTISAPFTIYNDIADNIWLYMGTGRFQVSSDKTDTSQNYLLGVKDPFYNRLGVSASDTSTPLPCYHKYAPTDASCTLTPDNLFNASPYVIKPNRVVQPLTGGVSTLTTWAALTAEVKKKTGTPAYEFYKGWYRQMLTYGTGASEREINKPTIFGGIALFPTYSPNSDSCGYGGSSNLYALYYPTGTAYSLPVLTGMNNTVQIQDTFFLGYGLSSSFGIHAAKEQGDSATVYSQMSTGVIDAITINPPMATRSGMEYWKEGR